MVKLLKIISKIVLFNCICKYKRLIKKGLIGRFLFIKKKILTKKKINIVKNVFVFCEFEIFLMLNIFW